MAGHNGGGRRAIFWLALIGLLGLVVGAIVGGAFSYRGANLKEVTRIVEVTREIEVERPIEITRSAIETRVVKVTRIVEVIGISPRQEALSTLGNGGTEPSNSGSVIFGILENDGRAALGTHTVALFPKTLLDDTGQAQPNRDQEIRIPVNGETGFAEAYALPAGLYVACLKSLLHTAAVGEIEVVAGEITRADLRWPADVVAIRVECVLR